LELAFEYATDYVMENTKCPGLGNISEGWCDIWAKHVKKMAPFVEVLEKYGHWFVVYDGVAYDSDTTEDGFAVPDFI
jgi:hypothetical protein